MLSLKNNKPAAMNTNSANFQVQRKEILGAVQATVTIRNI